MSRTITPRLGPTARNGSAAVEFLLEDCARDASALIQRIREIAQARPRFGFQRIQVLLRREGWKVNKKRVHRLYCLEGLQVRMRVRRKKRMSLHRGPVPRPTATNVQRSMDFVHDLNTPHLKRQSDP